MPGGGGRGDLATAGAGDGEAEDLIERLEEEANAVAALESAAEDDDRDSVAEPMYGLVSEVFVLKGLFKWLRRQVQSTIAASFIHVMFCLCAQPSFAHDLMQYVDKPLHIGQMRMHVCTRSFHFSCLL